MKGLLGVSEETNWGPDESAAFNDPLLDNFAHYLPSSTDQTVLTLAKVRRDDELVGIAPLIRLIRYRATRLLKENSRWWMDPLFGPFACKTTCLIDTSLMGFRYADPFVGLHVHWDFMEPFVTDTPEKLEYAKALSQKFQRALQGHFRKHGHDIDSTGDLARNYRLPGTFNHCCGGSGTRSHRWQSSRKDCRRKLACGRRSAMTPAR